MRSSLPIVTSRLCHAYPRYALSLRQLHSSSSIATSSPPTLPDLPSYSKEDAEITEARKWLKGFSPEKIPRSICDVSFARSSGPGGQNVNKVNSKATLRLDIRQCTSFLPAFIIQRLRENSARHLTKDDEIVIQSDNSRKQPENVEDCFRKLYRMIVDSADLPGETTKEQHDRVAKLKKRENEGRLKMKKLHGSKKAGRRSSGDY